MDCDAVKDWKLNIFKITDRLISLYSQNTNKLARKSKNRYRYLKLGIQEVHRKYVLVPADIAANNDVVVRRLHYINTLKQELSGTKAYEQASAEEKTVINHHIFRHVTKFGVSVDEDKERLPTFNWLPKLNKQPYKSRFIANPAHARLPNYLNC